MLRSFLFATTLTLTAAFSNSAFSQTMATAPFWIACKTTEFASSAPPANGKRLMIYHLEQIGFVGGNGEYNLIYRLPVGDRTVEDALIFNFDGSFKFSIETQAGDCGSTALNTIDKLRRAGRTSNEEVPFDHIYSSTP